MRVVYVANFAAGGNEDEYSVLHALQELGHDVCPINERHGWRATRRRADLLLCHHWHDPETLAAVPYPKAFWCFDRIADPDPTLAARSQRRAKWAADMTAICDYGFFTDGDWVAAAPTGKLHWLPQGADGRLVMRAKGSGDRIPILFTGTRRGGVLRESFVDEMTETYGTAFRHVERGKYGVELARLVADAEIVVAPDGPVSDKYWSNRIYLVLGFGGFLLHPWCDLLTHQYACGSEVVLYRDREQLHREIRHYWDHPKERRRIADAALARTRREHLYVHRVAKLIATVEGRHA